MKSFYIKTKIALLKSLKANNNVNTTALFFKKALEVFKIVLFVKLRLDKMILVTYFIVSVWKFVHLWNLFTYQSYRSIFGNSKFVISEAATVGVLEPVCVNLFGEPEVL